MTRQELKALSKQQIKGKIGILFLITLIIALITGGASLVANMIPLGSIVVSIFVTPAFALSMVRVYLMVIRDEKPEVGAAFSGFNDFWLAFKVYFFVGLYTFLWSLLFIIPGIIKSYSYSQAMYIAAENPDITAHEAIARSKAMMDGHKADLFVLGLSFIGWMLLAPLTLGILYIWLIPYMNTATANFYNSIKPQETVADEPCSFDAPPASEPTDADNSAVQE